MADINNIKAEMLQKAAGLSDAELLSVKNRLLEAAKLVENGQIENVIKDFSDNPFLTGILPQEVLGDHDRVHDQHDRIRED